MLRMVRRLPQPLKTLYGAWLVAFAVTLLTGFLGDERTTSLVAGVWGVVAVLFGLTVATDLNGAAEALAEAMKSYRPLGIDYSRSVLATPAFNRVFGAIFLVVGAVFVVQAVGRL